MARPASASSDGTQRAEWSLRACWSSSNKTPPGVPAAQFQAAGAIEEAQYSALASQDESEPDRRGWRDGWVRVQRFADSLAGWQDTWVEAQRFAHSFELQKFAEERQRGRKDDKKRPFLTQQVIQRLERTHLYPGLIWRSFAHVLHGGVLFLVALVLMLTTDSNSSHSMWGGFKKNQIGTLAFSCLSAALKGFEATLDPLAIGKEHQVRYIQRIRQLFKDVIDRSNMKPDMDAIPADDGTYGDLMRRKNDLSDHHRFRYLEGDPNYETMEHVYYAIPISDLTYGENLMVLMVAFKVLEMNDAKSWWSQFRKTVQTLEIMCSTLTTLCVAGGWVRAALLFGGLAMVSKTVESAQSLNNVSDGQRACSRALIHELQAFVNCSKNYKEAFDKLMQAYCHHVSKALAASVDGDTFGAVETHGSHNNNGGDSSEPQERFFTPAQVPQQRLVTPDSHQDT